MIKLLDTTLRDGSYVVDFHFSAKDTLDIALALENFGIEFIEVGHGLGLNAFAKKSQIEKDIDKEYLSIMSKNINKSKWGMFFIPGIGDFEDIDKAADYNMNFIRIGTNINESQKAFKYVEYAKKKGLIVSVNLMKSYAVDAYEFANITKEIASTGAEYVYLVDSAGGMMPNDIEKYVNETKNLTDVKLGFHGHDNLHMAVANSLKAYECGVDLIDTSLQGLGRGAGNTSTEIFMLLLLKKKIYEDFDIYGLMDYSETNIKPFLRNKGVDGVTLVSGFAYFHSSFMPLVEKYANKFKLDSRVLIVELCNHNIIELSEETICNIAQNLKKTSNVQYNINYSNKLYDIDRKIETKSLKNELKIIIDEIISLSNKYNKESIFNIVQNNKIGSDDHKISKFIQETDNFIIGSCELSNENKLDEIVEALDGNVDIIFLDSEIKNKSSKKIVEYFNKIKKTILLNYNDNEIWAKAIENLITTMKFDDKKILLVGKNIIMNKLFDSLSKTGLDVCYVSKENSDNSNLNHKNFDILVGLDFEENIISKKYIDLIHEKTVIIDGGIGNISDDVISYAVKNDISIIRTDMRFVMDSEIKSKLNSYKLLNNIMGKKTISNVKCVAGGLYGEENSVVLDSISKPKNIIGLADGKGRVKYVLSDKEKKILEKVENELFGIGTDNG